MDVSMETGTSTLTIITMADIQTLEQEVVRKDVLITSLLQK